MVVNMTRGASQSDMGTSEDTILAGVSYFRWLPNSVAQGCGETDTVNKAAVAAAKLNTTGISVDGPWSRAADLPVADYEYHRREWIRSNKRNFQPFVDPEGMTAGNSIMEALAKGGTDADEIERLNQELEEIIEASKLEGRNVN